MPLPVRRFRGNVTTFRGPTPTKTGADRASSLGATSSAELAPQAIGSWSGSLTGATELDFLDWPATIGIDNL
jgi:hypothetical protein